MQSIASRRLVAATLTILLGHASAPALAQTATPAAGTRAVEQAGDAFGVRVGVEQIGLYSESQVRGLSLQDAGNYRLNGAYFVRIGNLVDPVLGGVVTRVGFNALGFDFPSPSGVVEYRLRTPMEYRGTAVELGLREYGGSFAEAITSMPLADGKAGLLVGTQANLSNSSAGYDGNSYRFGVVGEWWPSDRARLIAFGTLNDFDFEGTYGVTATDTALPTRQKHPNRYVPRWGDHDGQDINGGAIATLEPADDLTLRGSLIYSRLDLDEADFVNLALDRNGRGQATIVANRPRDNDAFAGSVGASWTHAPGRRLFGEVRLRAARNRFGPGVAIAVPDVDQDSGLPDVAPPALPPAERTLDRARQVTAGLGYEANFDWLRVKGGVQHAFYRRRFEAPQAEPTSTRESPWLYDLSVAAAVDPRWTLFAAITRGLEDTGVAPSNAVNRNEVLPAAVAEQREMGLRWQMGGDRTLIASAFSIEKPAAVFDSAGRFDLSGDLHHRGVELSFTGRLAPSLRVVAGAAYIDAERSGERVRLGLTSRDIPGVSDYQALAGLTWSPPGLAGLSFDAQASHWGERRVRSDRELYAPAYTTVDLGGLYAFRLGEAAASLRLRILNLFDTDAWVAGRSELLDRVSRRGVRLSLSLRNGAS